jgi:outer membrane protein assembly factor BamB
VAGKVWQNDKIGHSLSTPAIADGLVYVGEFSGKVHCLDAATGQAYWVHDTKGQMWGSALAADGKVYVGNADGDVTVLAAGKERKVLGTYSFSAPIYSSAVAANGVLYVATQTHLYAIGK